MKIPNFRTVGLPLAAAIALAGVIVPGSGMASGASSNDIVVAGINEPSVFGGDVATGFAARIARANRTGGIDGRKIVFRGAPDDGSNASTDLALVQKFVDENHVFAVAPVMALSFEAASSNFLAQHHVPYIGLGEQPGFCGSKWGFGFSGCIISTKYESTGVIGPLVTLWHKLGHKSSIRIAISGGDDPVSKGSASILADDVKAEGGTVVYNEANVPITGNTTFTPYAAAIISANPDAVIDNQTLADEVGMSAALKAAGYKGIIMNFLTYFPGQLASQPSVAAATDGTYVNVFEPAQEDNTPAIKQEKADLRAIGKPTNITSGLTEGYWSADLLVAMLKATAAKGPLTPARFEKTVNANYKYAPEKKGGVGPLVFPKNETQPAPCNGLIKTVDNHYVSVVPFQCFKVFVNNAG